MKMMSDVHSSQIGVLILFTIVKCEVFTAITEVENLLYTYDNVLGNLKQYIEVEESRLDTLKKYLKEFTDDHEKAIKDIQKYVENPINAFTLIKRLSTDFERLKIVASNPAKFVWDQTLMYPTEEDLIGAALAIGRLQLFYKLNTTNLAEGNLKGAFGSPMTASDCYNLALLLYKEGAYNLNSYAAEWYKMALKKFNIIIRDQIDTKSIGHNMQIVDNIDDNTRNKYGELCRGDMNISSEIASKLHCSYLRNSPFLKLAPIKMEEVYKDPNMYLFYDVVSDNELEILKQTAGSKLKRASSIVGKKYYEHRIGKSAWLDVDIDAVVKVRQRAADFTGLSMLHAEPLQVLNYGIGGHYNLHYDAFGEFGTFEGRGDRFATVLFYMSDVLQGGATVFTFLNLTVTPKKGSALFWENLHPSGEINRRTYHAACPVLYGSKWVSNLWIHEAGQELLRPCPVIKSEVSNQWYLQPNHVLTVARGLTLCVTGLIIVKLCKYFVGLKYYI